MAATTALLEAAYTNVSLLADAAWAPCSMGPMGVPMTVDSSASSGSRTFRRANQDLWLRCVNLERYIRENNQPASTNNSTGNSYYSSSSSTPMSNGQNNGWYRSKMVAKTETSGEKRPRTVRDTIPFSRLASYGVQAVYDEERERLYTSDDVVYPLPPVDPTISEEPWLMASVEDLFKRLTTCPERTPMNYDECFGGKFQGMSRWLNNEPEHHPQFKFSGNNFIRDECPANPLHLQHSKSEPQLSNAQRYTLNSHEEIRLQMRIRAQAVQDLWTKVHSHAKFNHWSSQHQIQKPRQMNHHNHHHGHQQMPSSGRLTRHRSLSRIPVLQLHNSAVPQLNVDVPEFFPKTNGPPFGLLMGAGSTFSAGTGAHGGVAAHGGAIAHGGVLGPRHNNVANAVSLLLSPANELAYQEELFPYRNQHEPLQHHKMQSTDQVTGMFMRPPGNGTAPLGAPTRSSDPWFLSNIANSNGKSISPAVPPPPLPPPLLPVPPPPHKPLKATRHSARNGKMQFQSIPIPIPVYQRPPEFYTQQNEAATNGSGTGGSIGTRRRTGGNGVDFSNLILLTRGGKGHSRPCVPPSTSTPSVSSKTESFAIDTKPEVSNSPTTEEAPEPSQPPPVPPTSQSSDEVFQWLHSSFGSTKNRQQDLEAPPEASAENGDDASSSRRRLYRDVLARSGEDTGLSRPASPAASSSPVDKFELLEEEAVMQYQSSEDSLAERMQSQNQPVDSTTEQNTPKPRRSKDQGCKPAVTPPPPPPPVPPKQEIQSPRRRLYRDVLAHRRAENAVEATESSSWSDVLQRLEEQALMEYRMSDDATDTTGEPSQRSSEEALSRRYQDLERQALMQYLRSASSNTDVQATREGERIGNARGSSVLQRPDEDVMVNLKLLQRENPRPLPRSQTRSSNLQDNQDRRVYRKQVLKKPVQLQPEMQNLKLPQQVFNNSDQVQRAQQLLQEHRALLQITQQTFDQQKTPKLPQPEFLIHQQNYQLCQQPQPLSQLHLIELQQRLSHPGLSPQQVAELQTLYQHQTLVSPELGFLLQKSKKLTPKTTGPLQKQAQWRPQKMQPLENQVVLQQRAPLILSLPPIAAPQPQLMEMNRWMSSLSCPPSPAPHLLDLNKETALGGVGSSSQLPTTQPLQERQFDKSPTIQVMDTASCSSKLAAEESSRKSTSVLSPLNTDTEKAVKNTSPEKGQKSPTKSETKAKAKNSAKSQKKSKNRTGVKNSNGNKDRAGASSKEKSSNLPKSSDVSSFLKGDGNPVLRSDRKKTRSDETNNQAKRRRTEKEHKAEMSAKTAK